MTRRHETLRTRFVEAGGRLLQAVLPLDDPRAAPQLQRCSAPVNGNAQALVDLITDLSEAPFEMLGAGVPVRYALITCERGRQPATLFIGMHHVLRSAPCDNRLAPMSCQLPRFLFASSPAWALESGFSVWPMQSSPSSRSQVIITTMHLLTGLTRHAQRRHQHEHPHG